MTNGASGSSIRWRTQVKQGYTTRSALRQTRSGMKFKHTDGCKLGQCKVELPTESFQYVALHLFPKYPLWASILESQHVPGHPGLHNPVDTQASPMHGPFCNT